MTILSKDWKIIYAPTGSLSNVSSSGSVSTDVYPIGSYLGEAMPVIHVYPAESITTKAVDIRVASASEVAFLKDYLFGSVDEPLKTTLFTQKLYEFLGKPLYVWTDGSYIAAWFAASGLGFYVFVGYDAENYPTQEVLV